MFRSRLKNIVSLLMKSFKGLDTMGPTKSPEGFTAYRAPEAWALARMQRPLQPTGPQWTVAEARASECQDRIEVLSRLGYGGNGPHHGDLAIRQLLATGVL